MSHLTEPQSLVERLRALVPDGVADDPKSEVIREAADRIEAHYEDLLQTNREWIAETEPLHARIAALEEAIRGIIEKWDEVLPHIERPMPIKGEQRLYYGTIAPAIGDARALLRTPNTAFLPQNVKENATHD